MHIVRATAQHAAVATLLLNEYYESIQVEVRDSAETVAAYLTGSSSAMWITYEETQPAGCVALRPLAILPHAAECKRLYVRPSFRGRHIADALMDALESHAGASSIRWIYLDSKDDLAAALKLYKRRGYVPCERYNQNPQATVFLRKALY